MCAVLKRTYTLAGMEEYVACKAIKWVQYSIEYYHNHHIWSIERLNGDDVTQQSNH